jgi:hypothetical protein
MLIHQKRIRLVQGNALRPIQDVLVMQWVFQHKMHVQMALRLASALALTGNPVTSANADKV